MCEKNMIFSRGRANKSKTKRGRYNGRGRRGNGNGRGNGRRMNHLLSIVGLALTTCTVMLAVYNVNILYDLHIQWLDLAQEDGLSGQSKAQFIRERGGVGLTEDSGGSSNSSLVDSKSIIDSSGNSNSGINNGEPEQTYPDNDNDNENDTTSAPAPAPAQCGTAVSKYDVQQWCGRVAWDSCPVAKSFKTVGFAITSFTATTVRLLQS
mmetsp:Transcript_17291/g.26083  ORF Transcript_17291/g.26083 Transcript_17291/m.26083 type:complete len:208 (+) Transcript_17291:134-757(+)